MAITPNAATPLADAGMPYPKRGDVRYIVGFAHSLSSKPFMPKRWVVLSFDALATAGLSAYGSSWNETPAIDHLAAYGVTWDRCIVPSDDTAAVLQAFWQSNLAGMPWTKRCQQSGRVELFLNAGVQASQLAKVAEQLAIDQCTLVESIPESIQELSVCQDVEDTAIAKLMLPVLERINEPPAGNASDWSVLWVHSDTLTRCWDAPRSLFPIDEEEDDEEPIDQMDWSMEDFEKQSSPVDLPLELAAPILNEKPPALFDTVVVPHFAIPADAHPDLVISWMQTYGCQVRLIDRMIELLLASIEPAGRSDDGTDSDDGHGGDEIGLAILGTSGFSLGQNGWIGHRAGAIRTPQIQTPVLLFDRQGHGLRVPRVSSLSEVAQWLCPPQPAEGDSKAGKSHGRISPTQWASDVDDAETMITTDSIRADRVVTTEQWFLVRESDRSSLYLKPDDREDRNDVADRCRDVVESLESIEIA
jgi:hypothetical protein